MTLAVLVLAIVLAGSVPAFCEEAYQYTLGEKFTGSEPFCDYYIVLRAPKDQFFLDADWEFAGFLAYVPVQAPKAKSLNIREEYFFEFRGTGIKESPKRIRVNRGEKTIFSFSEYSVEFTEAEYRKGIYAPEYLITSIKGNKKRIILKCEVVHLSLNRGHRNIFEPLIEVESKK